MLSRRYFTTLSLLSISGSLEKGRRGKNVYWVVVFYRLEFESLLCCCVTYISRPQYILHVRYTLLRAYRPPADTGHTEYDSVAGIAKVKRHYKKKLMVKTIIAMTTIKVVMFKPEVNKGSSPIFKIPDRHSKIKPKMSFSKEDQNHMLFPSRNKLISCCAGSGLSEYNSSRYVSTI
ncbi:hypothetical protein CEXT_429741 [Caerostris extrusa]|uniref:Uncharacterized protein n=1 Tax=Caerostris extrusa TaxID=172846 RepID=A0AAV4PYY2_CAEEX|nr:hypothetical protein CEXT_429741 [Caerostris extrusa]